MGNYDNQTTAVGMLRSLMTTQAQVDSFSDQVIGEIQRGEINPLEVLIQLKAFDKASERIIKETQSNVIREAAMYPEQSFEVYGAQVTKAPTKTDYVFEGCNDEKLVELQKAFDEAKAELDKRKDFLKTIHASGQTIVTDHGEGVTVYPPLKRQIMGVKISIK